MDIKPSIEDVSGDAYEVQFLDLLQFLQNKREDVQSSCFEGLVSHLHSSVLQRLLTEGPSPQNESHQLWRDCTLDHSQANLPNRACLLEYVVRRACRQLATLSNLSENAVRFLVQLSAELPSETVLVALEKVHTIRYLRESFSSAFGTLKRGRLVEAIRESGSFSKALNFVSLSLMLITNITGSEPGIKYFLNEILENSENDPNSKSNKLDAFWFSSALELFSITDDAVFEDSVLYSGHFIINLTSNQDIMNHFWRHTAPEQITTSLLLKLKRASMYMKNTQANKLGSGALIGADALPWLQMVVSVCRNVCSRHLLQDSVYLEICDQIHQFAVAIWRKDGDSPMFHTALRLAVATFFYTIFHEDAGRSFIDNKRLGAEFHVWASHETASETRSLLEILSTCHTPHTIMAKAD